MSVLRGLVLLALFSACEHAAALPVAQTITVEQPDAEQLRTLLVRRWSRRAGVPSGLALAVSRAENWGGDSTAWSRTGCCVGVMQVHVRVWQGAWQRTCGSDLLQNETNVCVGVHVLRYYLARCGWDARCALREYGGWRSDAHAARYVAAVQQRLLALAENTSEGG